MKTMLHTVVSLDFGIVSKCKEDGRYRGSSYRALIARHTWTMAGRTPCDRTVRTPCDRTVRVSMEHDAVRYARCDAKSE